MSLADSFIDDDDGGDATVDDEYLFEYDVVDGVVVDIGLSLLIPILRYVPPEYAGLYVDGDVIVLNLGVDFVSDTSSLDGYCLMCNYHHFVKYEMKL